MRAARVVLALLSASATLSTTDGLASARTVPETVVVPSGALRLTGLVWRPAGSGPSPAVLFTHGSGPTDPALAKIIGPIFAKHGYVLLYLFRRGDGLSRGQGVFIGDVLDQERTAKGSEARSRLQLLLLTTDHLDDVDAGISFLKTLPGVDPNRIAVVGHSFGGQLAILEAERDGVVRAAVGFAAAAASWAESPALRARLLEAARHARAPVLLVYATNDFSTAPGIAIAAELERVGKTGSVKIYPAVGRTAGEAHSAVYGAPATWESDVFRFLDQHVAP
jgi:carboxymethylenebutenolidase